MHLPVLLLSPRIQNKLIAILGVTVLLCAFLQALAADWAVVLLGVPIFPLLVWVLIHRPQWWFILMAGLCHSWISPPGIHSSGAIFPLTTAAAIPVFWLHRVFQRRVDAPLTVWMRLAAWGLLGVLGVTAACRGVGIRFLGSTLWGGAPYFTLTATILFYLLSNGLWLSEKEWRVAVLLFFGSSIVPAAAEGLYVFSRGTFDYLYRFVKPDAISVEATMAAWETGAPLVRFQISKSLMLLFVLAVALWPFRARHRFAIVLSFGIAWLVAGFSGHRIAVLYLAVFLLWALYFHSRRFRITRLAAYGIGFAGTVFLLGFLSLHLPLSFQRALSWLPGVDVAPEAMRSAESTWRWRLELWRCMLDMLPDYWLLGRGFAFNVMDFYALPYRPDAHIAWALVTHNYHAGAFGVLMDMGVFGLVCAYVLLCAGCIRGWRAWKKPWRNSTLRRFHATLLAVYLTEFFLFTLLFLGGAPTLATFLLEIVMLERLRRSDEMSATLLPQEDPSGRSQPVRIAEA